MAKVISIIIPCYNEEESIEIVCNAVHKAMGTIQEYEYEILLINDGSTDHTLQRMMLLAEKSKCVKYYSFSRNFGKEAAIYAGLSNSCGDYIVTMDADMQDPPQLLPQMIAILETGEYDSVATRRVNRRGEPPIRSFCARMFYRLINKISNADIVDGARDYRLMTREMVNSVLSLTEYNRFSKGFLRFDGKSADDEILKKNPRYEVDFLIAPPRMKYYLDISTQIYNIYLKYVSSQDIHVYSIDEVFIDATPYLNTYHLTPKEFAMKMILDIYETTGITATAGIGTNLYLAKVAMDIVAKHKNREMSSFRYIP